MLVNTMQVATTLPVELVSTIDRHTARTMMKRAEWFRNAVLKQAEAEGILRVKFDQAGAVYELDLGEVAT